MSAIDKVLALLDVGIQTSTETGYATDHAESCARCQHHAPAERQDICVGCRAFLLEDSEDDPKLERVTVRAIDTPASSATPVAGEALPYWYYDMNRQRRIYNDIAARTYVGQPGIVARLYAQGRFVSEMQLQRIQPYILQPVAEPFIFHRGEISPTTIAPAVERYVLTSRWDDPVTGAPRLRYDLDGAP